MAGIEAAAALGLINNCIGIAKTIIDIGRAVHDAQGLPPKLRDVLEKLPAIEELLENAQENYEEDKVTGDASKSAEPVLRQCEEALGELRDIFRKACPKDGEARNRRVWKGAKAVFIGRDSRVRKLLTEVQDNLKLLEQKQMYMIGDRLDALQQLTEALATDESSKYTHTGEGNIFANEGGNVTNNVVDGRDNRQIISYGQYYEGPSSHVHNHLPPGRFHIGSMEMLFSSAHRWETDDRATPEQPESPPNLKSNVPRRDGQFVERPALIHQIRAKLSVPQGRAAIAGLGGVGKSQLAVERARQLRHESAQTWTLWIHASDAVRFEQSVRDVVDLLKIHGRKDPKADILRLLRNWLRDESKGGWLIVLDNVDDADFLLEPQTSHSGEALPVQRRIDYIPSCGHGSVVVTTRSKGEALKLVDTSEIITVLPMDEDEAEILLEKKLGHSSPGIRQLAIALDCMPLAIAQAAAHIREREPRYSVEKYRQDLEKNLTSRTSLLKRRILLPDRDAEAVNSVLLTWQISFEHIFQIYKSAAELLSLMSFCDRFAIPQILICTTDKSVPVERFEEDIVILRNYAFISATNAETWEMHRLVQDATQLWLEDRGRRGRVRDEYIHRLQTSFPTRNFEDWHLCRLLFPHVKRVAEKEHQPSNLDALLEWASVMYRSAWFADNQGDCASATAMAILSMTVRLEQLGAENKLTLASMEAVALTYQKQGRCTEAEQLLLRVVEISKAVLGEEHPNALRSIVSLASTYWNQGRLTEAEQLQLKVVETSKAVLGEEHPNVLRSIGNLASTYQKQGRCIEAAQLLLKVVETSKAVLGEEHPNTLTSIGNLALTYQKQGRWTEAEQLQLKVVETSKAVLGEKHPDTLISIGNLASTYWNQERWTEAEQLLLKVVETSKAVLGEEHPDTLTTIWGLASTYLNQGRWSEAEQLLSQAFRGSEISYGLQHNKTLSVQSVRAYIQSMRGERSSKHPVRGKSPSATAQRADGDQTDGHMVSEHTRRKSG